MNTKHTPGPWHIRGEITVTEVNYKIRDAAGDTLAVVRKQDVCPSIADANAALIAAAPDLLNAAEIAAGHLAKIAAFGDTIGDEVSKAQLGVALNLLRQAIAKAVAP